MSSSQTPYQLPNVFVAVCRLEPPVYYEEQKHNTEDNGPLPPMHPNSSSLFAAVVPLVNRLCFESQWGRNDGIMIDVILGSNQLLGFVREQEDAAVALGCRSTINVFFKMPGSTMLTGSVAVNLGYRGPFTVGALLFGLTYYFITHSHQFLNKEAKREPMLIPSQYYTDIRVQSLDRIPGKPNSWVLQCTA